MFVSIAIGVLIFGYAAWTLYRHVQRSKQGKCAGCSMSKTCPSCDDKHNPKRET
jgi:hypothetical protein